MLHEIDPKEINVWHHFCSFILTHQLKKEKELTIIKITLVVLFIVYANFKCFSCVFIRQCYSSPNVDVILCALFCHCSFLGLILSYPKSTSRGYLRLCSIYLSEESKESVMCSLNKKANLRMSKITGPKRDMHEYEILS